MKLPCAQCGLYTTQIQWTKGKAHVFVVVLIIFPYTVSMATICLDPISTIVRFVRIFHQIRQAFQIFILVFGSEAPRKFAQSLVKTLYTRSHKMGRCSLTPRVLVVALEAAPCGSSHTLFKWWQRRYFMSRLCTIAFSISKLEMG